MWFKAELLIIGVMDVGVDLRVEYCSLQQLFRSVVQGRRAKARGIGGVHGFGLEAYFVDQENK